MGLLRLINAERLAPLEELLANLGGTVLASDNVDASRRVSEAFIAPQRSAASSAPETAQVSTSASGLTAASGGSVPVRSEFAAATTKPSAPSISANTKHSLFGGELPTPLPQKETTSAPQSTGLSNEQVVEIKNSIQAQQKFLGELLEQSSRWELEGAELRIYFPADKRAFAEMLEGREPLEKVRSISSKVLGRAVRVCAKLEVVAAAVSASRSGSGTQELRAQFERDPMVRSMLQRFGGRIAEVKRSSEE
jgi:hypothetical protein